MFTAALLVIALNYTNNVILIKKEVTLITWMNLINSGPKKLHAKEYCMITLTSSSKVNKTKLQCLGVHMDDNTSEWYKFSSALLLGLRRC